MDALSPEQLIPLINQIHDLKNKVAKRTESAPFDRNFNRLFRQFEAYGLHYLDPIGEPYNETRTDCEATISGRSTKNLVISEVIKPIVYQKDQNTNQILQKAVVIVNG